MTVTLTTFFLATGLFLLLLASQVVWWRLQRPKELITPLFILFGLGPLMLHPLHQNALATWLLLSVTLVYIMVFPAVSAESPSLVLLRYIKDHPGLTRDQLCAALGNQRLLEDRLEDLKNDGLVSNWKPEISLTTKGRLIAVFFYFYRRLLGLPWGTA